MEKARGGFARGAAAAFPVTVPVLTGFLCLGVAYGHPDVHQRARHRLDGAHERGGLRREHAVRGHQPALRAFDPLQALLLSLMVNARHMFYGLSMLDRYKGMARPSFPLIYMLCDETFSIVSTVEPPPEVEARDFYLAVTLLDYGYWLAASLLGAAVGDLIPFDTTGMDFALTALFVVLFLEQWRKPENRPSAVIGVTCTVLSLAVFGADNLVIPAMVLILAALLMGRRRLCHDEA